MIAVCFRRCLPLAALLLLGSLCQARVTWVIGRGAPVAAEPTAQALERLLGEKVSVVREGTDYLSAWVNSPEGEVERDKLLQAETLVVSPAPAEPEALTFLALRAMVRQRDIRLARPIVLAAQKPVYAMNGLCDVETLRRTARLALGANCALAPFPRVWQQVYTDDLFYNGRLPQGEAAEAYVLAATVTLAARGAEAALAPFPGVHAKVSEELAAAIRKGYGRLEETFYLAERLPAEAFPLRPGLRLEALVYNGAFEKALVPWLERFAQAEGRELVIHYTTESTLESPLPGLFRTLTATPGLPNAACYTRPAFRDDSGLTELSHLSEILKADGAKPRWLPFPLAVAEWTRRLTGKPVYNGALPTEAAAAMFAAMVYLDWTGSAALPDGLGAQETAAIGIGLDVMLASRLRQSQPNIVLCRPLGDNRYAFSLWRTPGKRVTLSVATANCPALAAEPRALTFTPTNFFARKTVRLVPVEEDPLLPPPAVSSRTIPGTEGPLLLWKVPAQDLPGQNTGMRALPSAP